MTFNTSSANILPGNNGQAILAMDGNTLSVTGSWSKNGNATITPTTNGIVDVYMMKWPFSSANGTLVVSCLDTSANFYISPQRGTERLLSGCSSAQVQAVGYKFGNRCQQYFLFQALRLGCYRLSASHSGSISVGNTTSYTMADGNTTKAGMWFRKKSGIPNYSATTPYGTIGYVWSTFEPLTLTADLTTSLNLSNDYFFLPACGMTAAMVVSQIVALKAAIGRLRATRLACTPPSFTFTSDQVDLYENFSRTYDLCLWWAQ